MADNQPYQMSGYELSRAWFSFCFEHPEKINPNHTALYFFAVEHCNRLGWKEKFGLPTEMAKEAIGIKSYHTYSRTLKDLVEWGFIVMVQKSKNQYSSNVIALSSALIKNAKALDKATSKHVSKQLKSNDSINKQETIEQTNQERGEWKISKNEKLILDEIRKQFHLVELSQDHRDVMKFVQYLVKTDGLDYFNEQHDCYHKYKDHTGEKKHGIKKFIGTHPYENGEWCQVNWKEKYKSCKPQSQTISALGKKHRPRVN